MNFSPNGFEITSSYLEKMRDTMHHRGPDGGGVWVSSDATIGLAHRRLSIIDLSHSADQPMSNDDASIRLVFNGEIYNHAEIRIKLDQERTIHWQTDHSDTEVLLRAYETWSIDCLSHFRGMFAIAIWDANESCLWLVRDRIGIKPLYWSLHNSRIIFASEIKALLADPEQQRAVDKNALYDYLSFICTPGTQTLFAGISKLEPGHLLKVLPSGEIQERQWYNVWEHVSPSAFSEYTYSQVLDTLAESVELRKVGDVPVGVFLSGGVDSSTNAALFSRDTENPIQTFSIGYQGEYSTYTNELSFARNMANLVGADYYETQLSENDLINFLPQMIHLQDEPIGDPVCVPLYYVSKLARANGVTVCQVGEGADELFWGYSSWQRFLRLQQWMNNPLGKIAAPILKSVMGLAGLKNRREFDIINRASCGQPVFWGGAEGLTEKEKYDILSPEYRQYFKDRSGWDTLKPIWEHFRKSAPEPSVLNWMTYLELRIRLPELLLMRVDKMSMGVSLEARVPFLDHKLVEMALGIPQRAKTKNKQSKHILKTAVRGLIPDEVIDRKKAGFGVPVQEWLFSKLGDKIKEEIQQFCKDTNYFSYQGIEKLFASNKRVRIWYIYNFVLWHRYYIEQKPI
ncbi:asparagine synthase (glutamine-hydrolyzing) [Candidatus Endobugula sertula]|uniref:asparagine synthase (glutamine-hydrolyzing) n=1 Tax=Candidatus Endobugula sertula TaxID=62101 RepID=A0A1D2QPJ7_9GAMM|nr:asparagine synthase (glutamine-hydrolyzing) [Candidatus Endobugula sertula]